MAHAACWLSHAWLLADALAALLACPLIACSTGFIFIWCLALPFGLWARGPNWSGFVGIVLVSTLLLVSADDGMPCPFCNAWKRPPSAKVVPPRTRQQAQASPAVPKATHQPGQLNHITITACPALRAPLAGL